MIPLKDMTPRRSVPIVTLLLIAANIFVFAHQLSLSQAAGDAFVKTYGLTPYRVKLALAGHRYTLAQGLLPFITCMFLHGGFLHIIGNMWFLWIFGANVEDRLGSASYFFLYMLSGIGAGVAEVAFSWGSRVPSIGASGAISGVLGAYIVLFPASKILTLIPLLIFWFTAKIPAVIFIGLWFIVQFLSGLSTLGSAAAVATGGVAWWAHVGGFILGAFLVWVLNPSRQRAPSYY